MIHEQVQKQLNYLRQLVETDINNEKLADKSDLPIISASQKWTNIVNYETYRKEIQQHGDKNLLHMVKLKTQNNSQSTDIYPFAKCYVTPIHNDYQLIHRLPDGTELILNASKADIITT